MALIKGNCTVSPEFEFGNEDTGYQGQHIWKKLNDTVREIDCEFCRDKGIKMINGMHDSINIHLGKVMQKPKDFNFALNHLLWSHEQIR